MISRALLLLTAVGVLSACASPAPRAAASPATTASAPEPPASAAAPEPPASAAASSAAVPAKAAKAAPLTPPSSAYLLAGKSASETTVDEVRAAMEKLGWKTQENPATSIGRYEQFNVAAKNGGKMLNITVSRWAKVAKPIPDVTSDEDFAPGKLFERYKSTEGVKQVYDPAGQVLVSLTPVRRLNDAEAEKLLDSLVVKPR